LEREVPLIKKHIPFILSKLDEEAQKCIDSRGFYDKNGKDFVTNCIDGIGRCVFSKIDSKGGVSCYLETFSRLEGMATIRPVSCRLFPIRVRTSNGLEIIDYEVWEECSYAWNKGQYLLDFCREALLERFGKEWMDKLETIRQRRLSETP